MLLLALLACAPDWDSDRVPLLDDLTKVQPEEDVYPPQLTAEGEALFEAPVPMEGPVNTAGAEDSPYWHAGDFFFFFTPDPQIPAQEQVLDGVTGIWVAPADGSETMRVKLSDHPDDALDGCPAMTGDTLWFCSVRGGNHAEIDYWTATWDGVEASDWVNAGEELNTGLLGGELHIIGDTMWFGGPGEDSLGGSDLYALSREGGEWGSPQNLGDGPNTASDEYMPWVAPDQELWYTAPSARGLPGPALWRSTWEDGAWSEGVEMVGSFAGEPTVDDQGSVYFTHHFFTEGPGEMLEADIYVLHRR